MSAFLADPLFPFSLVQKATKRATIHLRQFLWDFDKKYRTYDATMWSAPAPIQAFPARERLPGEQRPYQLVDGVYTPLNLYDALVPLRQFQALFLPRESMIHEKLHVLPNRTPSKSLPQLQLRMRTSDSTSQRPKIHQKGREKHRNLLVPASSRDLTWHQTARNNINPVPED